MKGTMEKAGSGEKWVWALDAFEEGGVPSVQVAKLIRELVGDRRVEVEPVFVLDLPALRLSPDPRVSGGQLKRFLPASEKALTRLLVAVKDLALMPPKVLVQNGISLVASVRRLERYCHTTEAGVIVVGKHGRKGLDRALVGSFTDTLLIRARVPLLVVPAGRLGTRIRGVMFPTDLSPGSEALLSGVIGLCQAIGAKLTIFHHIPHPVERIAQTGVFLLGGGWVSTPDFISTREIDARRKAAAWAARAREAGLQTDLKVESSAASSAQAILEAVRMRRVDLVFMGTESAPIKSFLLGSVARRVIQDCPCPVWVTRSPSQN